VIRLISFGYGHPEGVPEAHNVLDLRNLLRDPHVDPELRLMTGEDRPVVLSVMRQPGANDIVDSLCRLANAVATGLAQHGGDPVLAVGCVGGRHRSVVVVNNVEQVLLCRGWEVAAHHRDIRKQVLDRQVES